MIVEEGGIEKMCEYIEGRRSGGMRGKVASEVR